MKSTVWALMPASDLFAASSTGSRRPATALCANTSYSCLHGSWQAVSNLRMAE